MNGILSQGRVLKGVSVCVTCIFILLIWKGVPTSAGAFRYAADRTGANVQPNIFGSDEELPKRTKRKDAVNDVEIRDAEVVAVNDDDDDAGESEDDQSAIGKRENATVGTEDVHLSPEELRLINNTAYTRVIPIRRIINSHRNRIKRPRMFTDFTIPNFTSRTGKGDVSSLNGEIDIVKPDENIPRIPAFLFREPRTKDERQRREYLQRKSLLYGGLATLGSSPFNDVVQRIPPPIHIPAGDHLDYSHLDNVDTDVLDDAILSMPRVVPFISLSQHLLTDGDPRGDLAFEKQPGMTMGDPAFEKHPREDPALEEHPSGDPANDESSAIATPGDVLLVVIHRDDENDVDESPLLQLPPFTGPHETSIQEAPTETHDTIDAYLKALEDHVEFDNINQNDETDSSPEQVEFDHTDTATDVYLESLEGQDEFDDMQGSATNNSVKVLEETKSEFDNAETFDATDTLSSEALQEQDELNPIELNGANNASPAVSVTEQAKFDNTESVDNAIDNTESVDNATETSFEALEEQTNEIDNGEAPKAIDTSRSASEGQADNTDIDASLDVLDEQAAFDVIRSGYFADYEDNQDFSSLYQRDDVYYPAGDITDPTAEDIENKQSTSNILTPNKRNRRSKDQIPAGPEAMYDQVANEVQRDIGDDQEAEADFKKTEVEHKRHTWRHFKLVTATLIFVWMCWFIISLGLCRMALSMSKKSALMAEAQ